MTDTTQPPAETLARDVATRIARDMMVQYFGPEKSSAEPASWVIDAMLQYAALTRRAGGDAIPVGGLLSCPNPWCDSEAAPFMHRVVSHREEWAVSCGCGFLGPILDRPDRATTAWNTRTTPKPPACGDAAAAEERDALLSALGWKTGPFGDDLSRKVILDDSAALRPEMVKARRAAQEAQGRAEDYRYMLGEYVHGSRSGVLGRLWEEVKRLRAATPRPSAGGDAIPAGEVDWREIARLAGEHGVRYRTNRALLQFLDAVPYTPKPPAGGDAGAVDLATLIEPWKNHHGPLPDYDSPIACVFDAGVQYAVELLAKELGVTEWTPCDGTEDYDGDLGGTLMNIVCEAMPLDRDGERMRPSEVCAALALPAPVCRRAAAMGEGERVRLRAALIETGRELGCLLADDVSTDFLMYVPGEARAKMEALRDGTAVHLNMLRGGIARPTPVQIVHLYGAAALRAALGDKFLPVPELIVGEPWTLADCPPGLFRFEGTLCFKNEYYTRPGQPEAYVVASGKYFWGGSNGDLDARNALIVRPITEGRTDA